MVSEDRVHSTFSDESPRHRRPSVHSLTVHFSHSLFIAAHTLLPGGTWS